MDGLDGPVTGCFDARDALAAGRDGSDCRPAPDRIERARKGNAPFGCLMLTGDSAGGRRTIARQAGIAEVEAGLDPAGKLARIRSLQQSGLRVAMVGDGINDAGALAQADAGIAMGTAPTWPRKPETSCCCARSPRYSLGSRAGRATLRGYATEPALGRGYNVLGIPMPPGLLYPAFHILLSPWVAAAAMALAP